MTALHLIPVPLSELASSDPAQSLTPDLLELTRQLRYFIVENAKSARAFLKTVQMPVPIADLSIQELPGRGKMGKSEAKNSDWDALLLPIADGHAIGLISEAGCPAVADPGSDLVQRAHQRNIPVMPHIGPSSLLLALMGSGLGGQRFAFHGYLPQDDQGRKQALSRLEEESRRLDVTQIVIETPYRNRVFFESLVQGLKPNTQLCVAADLTMPSQLIKTKTIEQWKKSGAPTLDKRPAVFLFKH
ncbi:MAG: SAM-dependent methyltransferase [Rhodocyclales bacterium]|nr:SAM-dependent methyltransferase [Rhodocyclales bacterium]